MFNGGRVCQDCHGGMDKVGDDFTQGFSAATPFPGGMTAGKRIPWASEPGCQSCHTGDAIDNLTTDPNVIKAGDGIRLLSSFRTNDPSAKPIVAQNRRFAENATATGQQILYRGSVEPHVKLSCEACHGSTHSEWPTVGSTGSYIPNDNIAPIQIQGYAGVLTECSVCHTGQVTNSLNGPHGMHPLGQGWVDGHPMVAGVNLNACGACHGTTLLGTVLSKVRMDRTVSVLGFTRTITKGTLLGCNFCH
jgi:hypothetical protein